MRFKEATRLVDGLEIAFATCWQRNCSALVVATVAEWLATVLAASID